MDSNICTTGTILVIHEWYSLDRNRFAMDDYTPFRRTYQPSIAGFFLSRGGINYFISWMRILEVDALHANHEMNGIHRSSTGRVHHIEFE